ncbi:hypothetical protein LUX34_23100 [Streptomyces werraensis]|nr:hypothetical protein [Streptomyces werraensis]
MHAYLAAPDRAEYEPFRLTREQAQFVLNLYAVDPVTGRRRYRRAVLSRPKGWGKSPLLAALTCAEALADVVPDGWDSSGEPVGGRGRRSARRGCSWRPCPRIRRRTRGRRCWRCSARAR